MIRCFVAMSSLSVKKKDVVGTGGLPTGAVVGIASAAFLLGLVVATVALLCILRYVGVCNIRYKKCKQNVHIEATLKHDRKHLVVLTSDMMLK